MCILSASALTKTTNGSDTALLNLIFHRESLFQRDHRILVPKGDTVLKAGDVMVIGAESFQDKDHIKLKEITLQQRNPWTNQNIRDLDISRHSIIVLVRRHKKLIIPSGNLTLLEGDTVILYTQTHMANADDLEI